MIKMIIYFRTFTATCGPTTRTWSPSNTRERARSKRTSPERGKGRTRECCKTDGTQWLGKWTSPKLIKHISFLFVLFLKVLPQQLHGRRSNGRQQIFRRGSLAGRVLQVIITLHLTNLVLIFNTGVTIIVAHFQEKGRVEPDEEDESCPRLRQLPALLLSDGN